MSRPEPAPAPISSTPVLKTVLVWGGIVTGVILVGAAIVGFALHGTAGMWSGVIGAAVGAVFPALTALSILFANRWFGTPNYPAIFFGIFLGGWLVKLVAFIAVLALIVAQDWIVREVLYVALVGTVLASFAVDAVVILRMRVSGASDVSLPGDDEPRTPGAR